MVTRALLEVSKNGVTMPVSIQEKVVFPLQRELQRRLIHPNELHELFPKESSCIPKETRTTHGGNRRKY
jgi:hypothetical protein